MESIRVKYPPATTGRVRTVCSGRGTYCTLLYIIDFCLEICPLFTPPRSMRCQPALRCTGSMIASSPWPGQPHRCYAHLLGNVALVMASSHRPSPRPRCLPHRSHTNSLPAQRGKNWSRDDTIDVPATPTLPDTNLRYQEALDRCKWTKGGCSFLLLSAQF